ncbi:MAG: ABC transporter ATP-binding protein, partial [Candidatus Sericytochromatia bacterium]
IMAFKYNSQMALTLLIFIPFMMIGGFIFDKIMSPKLVKIRSYVADVSSYITEIVHGISIIQIFNQESKVLNELKDRSGKKLKLEKQISIMFNSFFNILFFSEIIATGLILYIGTDLILKGEMSTGSLILFINSVRQFFMPIMHLSGQFNEFQKGLAGANRIFDLLDADNQIPEPKEPKNIPNKEKGINIEFKDVWFKYNDNSDWVLKGVSFNCPIGEHWALVGPTGSGKTSIISLILKFYLPQKGEILLNGVNISDITSEELRDAIGLVLQDNILFPGSVYNNLTLNSNKYNQEKVFEILEELGINSIIKKFPQGYDTELRENGSNLSAGEKQIISFGRALLKDPAILIFDEATSNIDPEIENRIKNAMNNLMTGKTAIIIAHRLSTIQQADNILVLKKGELIESGSHSELMIEKGFYSNLNKLQNVSA